jgi:hypothetical protein
MWVAHSFSVCRFESLAVASRPLQRRFAETSFTSKLICKAPNISTPWAFRHRARSNQKAWFGE